MADKRIYKKYPTGINLLFTALLLALIVFGASLSARAAETGGQEKSADEVARELANPNSSLATLTLKNQYRWYTGDLPGADNQDNYTMLFQPVFPLSLPKDDNGNARNVFFRPGFPILFDQPVPRVENGALDWDGVTALGDIGFDIAYGVSAKSGFIWAWAWWVPCLPQPTRTWPGDSCGLDRSLYWQSLRSGASTASSQATNGMLPAGPTNPLIPPSSNPFSSSFWAMAGMQGVRPLAITTGKAPSGPSRST